jgi:hypothetical protein
MRKICPDCHGIYETQFLCPNCGVQLLDEPENAAAMTARGPEELVRAPEMATRFLAGLLLAQGSYYGVRLMATAVQMSMGNATGYAPPAGPFADPGLMLMSCLAGSLIAGAGNARALAAGAALGLIHALALIAAPFALGNWPNHLLIFGGWGVLSLVGAFGARIGRFAWPPLSDIRDPTAPKAEKKAKVKTPPTPIAWLRVFGGAALSIGCTVWAGPIRDYIIGTSGGKFVVDSRIQSHFVTWGISALAMMVGGVFAGASTQSGLKHGFLVGFLSCIGIFVIHSQVVHESLPAEKFFASVFGFPETDELTPPRLGLFLITNALLLGIFGGFFGSTLLPRITGGQGKLDRGAI